MMFAFTTFLLLSWCIGVVAVAYGSCVLFLCIVLLSICLQNVKMRTRVDENYRYLALKYGMIDMSTTLNCMLLDLVSWELLVASSIIIFPTNITHERH